MQLLLRTPFSRRDAREPQASWPTTLFVAVASGFVASELVGAWPAVEHWFFWAPEHISKWMTFAPSNGWLNGVWYLGVFPAALWVTLGTTLRWSHGASSLGDAWRRMAFPIAVVVSAAHMAKGLEKLSTWGGFLPAALKAPDGVTTALAISSKSAMPPASLLPHPVYAGTAVVLISLGLLFGIREGRLAGSASWKRLSIPLVVLSFAYGACAVGWAFR